ncbi:hypothetical protein ASPWEDRAFT_29711 [Aspergillus wentii DTO 134E9]|uniref:SMP-30/Gluconolactonase/LRE-like region domain-containing protein n=1 Tax=Aspergillus wentii DTO 134E9 TaxID=1073089 RepID=A0A1L9RI88_ASPWE|nr:uncharacterized protein ASPWEDRAFT_29711 [Aspergillus wentii DTO 134E9]OJJ34583.1 hypothetical protein ASPWEDRAFT_29711 [Aspergillus wentii DTO 134E9]
MATLGNFVTVAFGSVLSTLLGPTGTSHIPDTWTYLLPGTFISDLHGTFLADTSTSDASINRRLGSAASGVITCYQPAELSFCHRDLVAEVLLDLPGSGAFYEAGIYVPFLNEVWFTGNYARYPSPSQATAYNLQDGTVRNITQVPYGAGGTYFDGLVYMGNIPPTPGTTTIDPSTLETTTIFNSYFGLPFSLVDDIAWATHPTTNKSYLFFTTFFTALEPDGPTVPITSPVLLPNGVWRWDPDEKILLPIISRLDIVVPNGITVSPDHKTLYITDSLGTGAGGVGEGNQGYAPTAGPSIYAYDLNDAMLPVNRRQFGLARTGYPDGVHVDDAGRVWTAEGEGIVIRSAAGKVLAVFNSAAFGVAPGHGGQISNFALAGDMLVVGGGDRLYGVRLGETVATGCS